LISAPLFLFAVYLYRYRYLAFGVDGVDGVVEVDGVDEIDYDVVAVLRDWVVFGSLYALL